MIPVNTPLLNGNEKRYLNECIDSGWISCDGPFVDRFEREFAAFNGRHYGIAVANGSAALDVAVAALSIQPGDEVIMPTFTIISCAQAVVRSGGIPILVDSDPLDWNMTVEAIEEKITQRTKAIMAVHMYGLPSDMEKICALAEKYHLKVIEDAAQAIGQTCNGKRCGSFGQASVFSFYPNKHITTGEGGMVLTDDEQLAERCRSFRNLCFQKKQRFVHEELGWNYRMTNLQAAVGCAQLEQLNDHLDRKRAIGGLYQRILTDLPVQRPLPETRLAKNLYWAYGLVLGKEYPGNAAQVMARLADHGIGSRPFFWPIHQQPVFKKMGLFDQLHLPVAENLAQRGFYLPSGLALTDHEIEQTGEVLRKILTEP